MPDGGAKTALALRLFGRGGKDLIPVLNQGAASLNLGGAVLEAYRGQTLRAFKPEWIAGMFSENVEAWEL